MSYVVCLIYCIAVRIVLILLVYVYLFQHYCTGATMKTIFFIFEGTENKSGTLFPLTKLF